MFCDMPLDGEPLILASASPRRSEILRAAGWEFTVAAADVDETPFPDEAPADYVERLAQAKASAVAVGHPGRLVLGADTTVVIDGEILGKPVDAEDARRMLRLLSGRWHQVLTGVALIRIGADPLERVTHQTTEVKFAPLSGEEIDWYVGTGEPMDKAGAYAVQGQGAIFIEQIRGDYWNVVGLPIQLVYRLVRLG
jgi:septum formation protein